MKIIAKRRLYNDLLICAAFVCLIIILNEEDKSQTIEKLKIEFQKVFLQAIRLKIKKADTKAELEKIIYSSIKVSRLEKLEGLFFFSDMMGKNKNSISPMRVYVSLSIFKQFYIIFDNEVQKKQIMQLLKEWEVEVTIDKKFAQQKEYERVVAEKTQMREERKRLYEDRKKRKR